MKTTFASNNSTVILPKSDTLRYAEAIDKYGVTDIIAIPTMFARIIRESEQFERFDLSRMRKVMLGSAPMTEARARTWQHIISHRFEGIAWG